MITVKKHKRVRKNGVTVVKTHYKAHRTKGTKFHGLTLRGANSKKESVSGGAGGFLHSMKNRSVRGSQNPTNKNPFKKKQLKKKK